MGFCTFLDITDDAHALALDEKLDGKKRCMRCYWPANTDDRFWIKKWRDFGPEFGPKTDGNGFGKEFELEHKFLTENMNFWNPVQLEIYLALVTSGPPIELWN